MASTLDVRTDAFDRAADVLIGDVLTTAHGPTVRLTAMLAGSAGMAGSDPPAREWAHAYDRAAAEAIAAARSLFDAIYRVGVLLEHAGRNYSGADGASTAGGVAGLPVARHELAWHATLDRPPPAGGTGSADAPAGWGLVEDVVGYLWPDGHQDQLRAAALAWQRSADGLDAAAGSIPAAGAVIATSVAPEIDDVLLVLSGLRSRCSELAGVHRQLARACDELAAQIDHVHAAAKQELVELVIFVGATEVAGAALSVVSFGAAEVPAQVAVAARVAVVAARLRGMFAGVATTVRAMTGGLAVSADLAETVTVAMQRLLRLRPVFAGAEQTRALPMLAKSAGRAKGAGAAGGVANAAGRATVLSKAESPVWQRMKAFRGKTRTNGLRGRAQRFYQWDHRHGAIEVFDGDVNHLGPKHCDYSISIKTAAPPSN